ncbi:MAG: SRPBCC family protein [Deltaproteobacteria bacterium]|nr:SRPBCC family protein [Deltaproteobacteria bacterium]
MSTRGEGEQPSPGKSRTTLERRSPRELVVTRTVDAPPRLVFEAWTKAELFKRWWVPKSFGLTLLSCEIDARVGGKYRLVFSHQGSTMEFFGVYREVTPHSRLVWTNEEGDGGVTVTTVSFDEKDGKTLLVVSDLYPSEAALDTGSTGALPETLDQLEELLVSLRASTATQ